MRYGQLFILGEAWGEHEARARAPFVGPSGYELTRILDEAGISRRDCYLSNVFNLQPKDNRIEDLCGTPSIPGYGPISKGKTIKAEYAPQLNRLLSELRSVQPNLVLGVGNTAAWFLLNTTGISKIRGAVQTSPLSIRKDGLAQKCLLTYHPAAVLRQWELRPTVVSDCIKAKREAAFPEVRRPRREIWIAETLEDIALFYHTYLKTAREIAFDIETSGGEITCIGFAGSQDKALVIPFFDPRKEGWSFWPFGQERTAWEWVRAILNLPAQKTAHNGVYDIHFLWRKAGMTPVNYTTDTMLMHHALQPEARKALGYLGSVYTNEAAWKLMRHSNKIQERRDK